MTVDIRTMKVAVLVNAASGGCTPQSGELLQAELARRGVKPHAVWCGPGAEVEAALHGVLNQSPDLLIVLGGDGTVRTAAQHSTMDGPLLIPLPGGTMNLVARRLSGHTKWQAALEAVMAAPSIRTISGAQAGGQRFFAGAMLGQPALLADAREAARTGDLAQAVRRGLSAVRSTFDEELTCILDSDEVMKGEVVSITCPLMQDGPIGHDAQLDIAAADLETATDAVRLVLRAPFRDWRADQVVARATTRQFQVKSRAAIPALLDGEQFSFGSPLSIASVPAAFRAIVPEAMSRPSSPKAR